MLEVVTYTFNWALWIVAHLSMLIGALWLYAEISAYRLQQSIRHSVTNEPIPTVARFAMLSTLIRVKLLGQSFNPIEMAIEKRKKMGPAFLFYRGKAPMVMVSDLEDVKKILQGATGEFDRSQMPGTMAIAQIFGKSIIASVGETWRLQRRTCEPGFKYKRIKDFIPLYAQLARKVIRNWEGDIKKNGGGKQSTINIEETMTAMTQDAIGLAGFSYDFNALDKDPETLRQRENYKIMMAGMFAPLHFIFPFLARLPTANNIRRDQARIELADMLTGIIKLRRAETEKDAETRSADLLDHILALQDENGMSDEVLLHNLFLFFIAGHDTTSSSMTSALYFLAKHPEIQEKAHLEACAVISDPDNIDYSTLRKLEYIGHIVQETLRMHPPTASPPPRMCIKEEGAILGGYKIAKGQMVLADIINTNYNEQVYPEPRRFNPDRFATVNKHLADSAQFLTFSTGPRICLGMKFALSEMTVVLALLLRQFKFELPAGFVWRYRAFHFTIGPENGLPLHISSRSTTPSAGATTPAVV